MKKLILLFCLISTALFSQPVLTGRQGGTGVANTNKTITLGSSLSWPSNGSGVLSNDGSGNLSWGAAAASTFTINGTSMTTGNAYTVTAAAGTLTGSSLAAGVTSSSLTSFGASPTFTTPILGTPASGTLTNCTGLPVAGTLLSVSAPLTISTNTLAVTTVGTGSVPLQGALTSYTPTWTNGTIGNGTWDIKYIKTRKVVYVWGRLQTGSTTTYGSGSWSFTLPSTAESARRIGGSVVGFNSGVAIYGGNVQGTSTTTFQVTTQGNGNPWQYNTPGTWTGAGVSYIDFFITYSE